MLADADYRLRVLAYGGICGVFAFLLGYAGTYAVVIRRTATVVTDLGLAVEPATWRLAGVVFYISHFARMIVPGEGLLTVDVFVAGDVFSRALIGIPALSLLVAGLIAGRLMREDTIRAGAHAGAALVLGYLPLALLGFALFEIPTPAGVVAPEPWSTLLLVGIVVPAVFGTLGGITGART